ncbi:MAG: SDR family NAD(P)-dependent oxidoreductase [Pseudomonadales bacterium]|nr:SDR family NAD(P)-dependent oxidoreductase [Pseudomonadales bacterium]
MPLNTLSTMAKAVTRALFSKYPMVPKTDLSGKNIIVTGASPGSVGYETAKTLAGWGAQVVVTARSKIDVMVNGLKQDLAQQQLPANITGHPLDLTDTESVEQFAQWYQNTFNGKLDILINNAGVFVDMMGKWKEQHLSQDGYEVHWRTNYLGPMHLTHLLLPMLRQSAAETGEARIVFVASVVHERGSNQDLFQLTRPYNSWQAYGNSKLGLLHAAFELNRRFKQQNIKSYVLHPGSIASNIAHKGLEGAKVFQTLLGIFSKLQALLMLTPQQGAQTQIYCATQSNAQAGKYYDRCEVASYNPHADNVKVSERLWQQTEQWVNNISQGNRGLSTDQHNAQHNAQQPKTKQSA